MKKYDAYKPSGVDWIGNIPERWKTMKTSWIFKIGSGTTPKSGDTRYYTEDGGYNWLQTGDLNDCVIIETSKHITEQAIQDYNLKFYSEGSLVIALYGATIGKVGILGIKTTVNQACCVLNRSRSMAEKYAFYVFQAGKPALLREAYGGGQPNISQDIISTQKYPFPPLAEQKAIADYLDAKCAKIDNVVAVQRKRIELLKELKQSIITHAVTKGLDKTAKMKDSGIEWIGEIPDGWEIKKIKHNFEIYAGATPKTEKESFWDGDIVWITPADYKTDDKIVLQGERNITIEGYNSCNTQLVPQGSLIFSKRAPIGTVALSGVELCTNQGCLSCVPKKVNSLYYYYAISICTEFFDMLGAGATFKEISADAFANVKLPTPPLYEQTAIADYLDKKCAIIDKQIAKVEKQIELLNEYKLSVITECVTGKRKVC